MRHVYGAYARFVGYAMPVQHRDGDRSARSCLVPMGVVVSIGKVDTADQIAATLVLLVGYVITALGFSTIYRATVLLSLWQLGMESLQLSGLSALEKVKASRQAKLRARRGSCRRAECRRLLMPSAIEGSHAMNSGAGIYFDGVTSARRDVVVELAPAGLQISGRDGHLWAQWPYDEIEELAAPDNILRLGRRGSATLERLEIRDPAFAAEIDARAAHVDRTGSLQRRQRMRVIGWSVGATASLLLVAWFGVPAIAARLTPLLPVAVERKLGDAVNVQVRGMLDTRKAGAAFDCGTAAAEMPGRTALDKLVRRLEAAAALRCTSAHQCRAPGRGQCLSLAGRTRLCISGTDRQS